MMDLALGNRAKNKMNMKEMTNGKEIGVNYDSLVIIKVPDSLVLRVISRSLLLAIFIITLPFIGSIFGDLSSDVYDSGNVFDITGFESFPVVFQDLADEGLLKMGNKGLILSSGIGDQVADFRFLYDNDIDLVIESDFNCQGSVPNEAFDVVFVSSFQGTNKFIDRILRVGGIVVMQLSNDPSNEFRQDSNYKIVYLRRFDVTVVAMRKTGLMDGLQNSQTKRRLYGVTPEAKIDALKGLEDVWLEPPRRALANQWKNFKFLPDLMGDSLDNYPRRVFITDDKSGSVQWFKENYPTRNQEFEIYGLEMEMNNKKNGGRGLLSTKVRSTIGISDWMLKNVGEEDYVVMKAEAEMVEEMMNEKTISLVDELFLECKNQWQDGTKSTRPYWQCLALYGKLRDEGIAVHQWWN